MESDLKNGDYFAAGQEIAEIVALVAGPVETEVYKFIQY